MELEHNGGAMGQQPGQEGAAPAARTLEEVFSESETSGAATRTENDPEQEQQEQENRSEKTDSRPDGQSSQNSLTQDQIWAISRRKAEAQARERTDRMFAQRFGHLTNPVTGKPIQTAEDYFAALDAQEQLRREQAVRQAASGMEPEQARQLMDALQNDPARRRLEEENQQLQTRVHQMQRQQDLARGEQLIAERMAQISRLDPEMKSLEDIRRQPEFGEFDRLVRGGYDLVDAYKLAFFQRLQDRQASGAKQAAINAARGKQHLAPVGGKAGAEDGLTEEIIAEYRRFNPKWTREDISRFHKNYSKGE